MLLKKNGKINAFPFAILSAIMIFWEFGTPALSIPSYLFPVPSVIFATLLEKSALIIDNFWPTFTAFAIGFITAVFFGILFAVLITKSETIAKSLMPLLILSQTIPIIALAPLFAIWFGHGIAAKILIAFVFAFFPITVNTVKGLKAVDKRLLEMMDSIGAKENHVLLMLKMPTAQPYIFAALKLAITYSLIGAITGELVSSNIGLGNLLIKGLNRLDTPLVFAIIVVVSLLGLFFYKSVEWIEQYTRHSQKKTFSSTTSISS